jgi:hypothetical protein
VLFSDLSSEDSAAVIQKLKEKKIKYEVRGDGSAIAITPPDLVHETRIELSGEGVPRGGVVGLEIFDAANTIDSVLRSLQGTDLYKRAKESGAEMISFLQQSIKTVQSIISEAGEQEMTNKSKY